MTELERAGMEHLLNEIRQDVRNNCLSIGRTALSQQVIDALRATPRTDFLPACLHDLAYVNCPMPFGFGQTTSQPYLAALMLDLIEARPSDSVLEIGTGSAYQSALLARLAGRVYSIEIIDALAQRARERLAQIGIGNVLVRSGDGQYGWPEHAPYDAIVVTAAIGSVRSALIGQLKPGGILVMPMSGNPRDPQLRVLRKEAARRVEDPAAQPLDYLPPKARSHEGSRYMAEAR